MNWKARSRCAAGAMVILSMWSAGATAQTLVEVSAGAAIPVGRLAEFQDRGGIITLAVEHHIQPAWSIRTVVGRAAFEADDRQHPNYADAPWIPFEIDLWTVAIQWVGTIGTDRTSMSTSFGLGADILRTSPLYDHSMDSPAPLRETYPSMEAGIRVALEVLSRLAVVGDVRGHLTLTSAADTKAMFVAGGARPTTEDGSRLLGHVPMTIGIRLAL